MKPHPTSLKKRLKHILIPHGPHEISEDPSKVQNLVGVLSLVVVRFSPVAAQRGSPCVPIAFIFEIGFTHQDPITLALSESRPWANSL